MNDESISIKGVELDEKAYPDLKRVRSLVLREGPRSKVELTYTVIRNRHTNEFHHDCVSIKSYRKKQGRWIKEPTKSITVDSDETDDLETLVRFIQSNRSGEIPEKSAEFLVLDAPNNSEASESIKKLVSNMQSENKVDVLLQISEGAAANPQMFDILMDRANREPKLFAEAAAALNLAQYINALEELKRIIESKTRVPEQSFQKLLKDNPWMFGSEYSELLRERKLTRDEEQDFILRRTTDNFLEIIEIKTPLLGSNLFNYDASHDTYYQSAELSKVFGQVQNYLEQVDADRFAINRRDGEDPLKIRAKIIIGRDGDDSQKFALRRLNGHLHRIEVITFDQLLNMAKRVVDYLESAIRPEQENYDDLPF